MFVDLLSAVRVRQTGGAWFTVPAATHHSETDNTAPITAPVQSQCQSVATKGFQTTFFMFFYPCHGRARLENRHKCVKCRLQDFSDVYWNAGHKMWHLQFKVSTSHIMYFDVWLN